MTEFKGQQGFTVWFTGLSGAGKTTLGSMLERELRARGINVERLDGDVVRRGLCRDLGFSREDRMKNIERVCFVARLLNRNGIWVTASFITPYRLMRSLLRKELPNYVEVYVQCPLSVLMKRDTKGLYRKALAGEIADFTGISDPFEEPENPDIVVRTDRETPEESLAGIIAQLEERNMI
ncbi:MAG: adenylyl-sulfate kinase [Peptococcaceae bacterium]|nr:adenylyl-sulfate kinase [Peptococcaceae bacterium]